MATRAAYGKAIVDLAEQYPELVVLDADLASATMTNGFMKAYRPRRGRRGNPPPSRSGGDSPRCCGPAQRHGRR